MAPESPALAAGESGDRAGTAGGRRGLGAGRGRPARPGSGRSGALLRARLVGAGAGAAPGILAAARRVRRRAGLDRATSSTPSVLTIGFARRVPSYKRLTLMLHDPERLRALLLDPQRPVQIVIAGKAHPADDGGKQLIQQMVRFADDRGRAAPDRVPARLRHGAGARAWCRAATCG